jgi:hypothetical protein
MWWIFSGATCQQESHARPFMVQPIAHAARGAETLIEAQIVVALDETGNISHDNLVRRVAEELYQGELRHGAAVIDIGIVGSRLFERDVIETIRAANGVLWKVDRG